ncbi:helix-turn-helix transcriptional regulator [Pseudoalteromonas prydzensis]|uniref:AlpA family phage regulatory protein n=1 Tax=Pseudoalteromonas prydzensis TaxID=182141 RepID=A0ABR9FSZ9_9GAMM|nr:AlpA family phage regulatory protein [Pseudoalteromonas prydzensis]
MGNQIVRPNQLAKELDVSLCTLWRWRQQNKLPQPIQLGPRLVGWKREVIEEWLDSQNNG